MNIMKTLNILLVTGALTFGLALSHAQPGAGAGMSGPPPCPKFGNAMAKLFGPNNNFSANLEFQFKDKAGDTTFMPGKLAYADGKSCFEVDMARVKSPQIPAGAGEQLKQMGMDKMLSISRPDKKISWFVYPSMNAHVEMPLQARDATTTDSDSKVEVTKLGNEKIDGHDCVKNKVVVTDKDGSVHEATVWNASDLKEFPVRIETTEEGNAVVKLFKDVKLGKPDSALFDPPKGSTKYENMMSLLQTEMMKRLGGPGGLKIPGQ